PIVDARPEEYPSCGRLPGVRTTTAGSRYHDCGCSLPSACRPRENAVLPLRNKLFSVGVKPFRARALRAVVAAVLRPILHERIGHVGHPAAGTRGVGPGVSDDANRGHRDPAL